MLNAISLPSVGDSIFTVISLISELTHRAAFISSLFRGELIILPSLKIAAPSTPSQTPVCSFFEVIPGCLVKASIGTRISPELYLARRKSLSVVSIVKFSSI
ncbi:hypothetical protein D3C77_645470 [compost metagenome]